MSRWIASFITAASIVGAGSAHAQETPGPGRLEVAIAPGGATFFTKKEAAPSFGNYDIGGAAAYNFTRMFGVEGEVGGSFGIRQDLSFRDGTLKEKTPNMLSYSGNFVVNASGRSLVPYATVGIGGLSMFDRSALGIADTETFLTGNAGGGLKWFAANDRWRLRGDYRFMAVRSNTNESVSDFFGRESRFGHRVYGAVVINAVR